MEMYRSMRSKKKKNVQVFACLCMHKCFDKQTTTSIWLFLWVEISSLWDKTTSSCNIQSRKGSYNNATLLILSLSNTHTHTCTCANFITVSPPSIIKPTACFQTAPYVNKHARTNRFRFIQHTNCWRL